MLDLNHPALSFGSMKRIKLTQGKTALVDDSDFEKVSQHKWYASKFGEAFYAQTGGGLPPRKKAMLMHRFLMDAPKGMQVDHINHNGLDNRRENLRLCTDAQNKGNLRKRKNRSSKYKGVNWDKTRKKWGVRVKQVYVGRFDDEVVAAKAYDKRAKEVFGEFAHVNFPVDKSSR